MDEILIAQFDSICINNVDVSITILATPFSLMVDHLFVVVSTCGDRRGLRHVKRNVWNGSIGQCSVD